MNFYRSVATLGTQQKDLSVSYLERKTKRPKLTPIHIHAFELHGSKVRAIFVFLSKEDTEKSIRGEPKSRRFCTNSYAAFWNRALDVKTLGICQALDLAGSSDDVIPDFDHALRRSSHIYIVFPFLLQKSQVYLSPAPLFGSRCQSCLPFPLPLTSFRISPNTLSQP
jgi:hypothetical protein